MTQPVPLTTGLGEVMAPGILVTALLLGPDGQGTLDPGALHGRSALEGRLQFVRQRAAIIDGQAYWVVWIAIELDTSNVPARYHGLAVSELWVDLKRGLGHKSVAGQVNRMSEAMRGGVDVTVLGPQLRQALRRQLVSLSEMLWKQSPEALKQALER